MGGSQAINLSADTKEEQQEPKEEQEEIDYEKLIRDIERDAEAHQSWNGWSFKN